MATVSFGIKTAPQHTTYEDIVRVWQQTDAESVFTHAWVFDHFTPLIGDITGPCLEGWTLISALAALTSRVRVGVMVTGNTYRHPAVLANMAATVDIISHGRLDFGIGAGWNEAEHTMYGIPLFAPAERIHRLDEACDIIRRLWTEPRVTFAGRYYQLENAVCEPKPVQQPHPPFVIGGGGEQLTLRVVARFADIWNFSGSDVDMFIHKSGVLKAHCETIGRDDSAIQRSVQLHVDPDRLVELKDVAARMITAGATHLVFYLRAPYPDDIVQRVAREVAMPLAEHSSTPSGS